MLRKSSLLILVSTLVYSVSAGDYLFPSTKPPAGKDPKDVKQYIAVIWDDNAYSCLKDTRYEDTPDAEWSTMKIVGSTGVAEGTFGTSWAVRNLAGKRKNPDGGKIRMNFMPITGQMAPVTGKWSEQGGTQFGWKGYQFTTVNWADPSKTVLAPVCWGREYETEDNPGVNYTVNMYKEILSSGHEMGSHTIDHMETNSGLPKKEWPNNGEGFDNDPNENEAYPVWENIGWITDAGRKISQKAWEDVLTLAENELTSYLGVSVSQKNLFGLRAPRLEINANALFALKNKGYLFDCSLEEGYEEWIDGTNLLWPYTTDNGSVNGWTQKEAGDPIWVDSMPCGLWEIPVNAVIVPQEIRQAVWNNAKVIATATGDPIESFDDWNKHGKITGFDFNMYILWGMTSENWLKTMKYNLDLRLGGNKAPFEYGCHSDYYTPIYDNATLLKNDPDTYGLVVKNGWNTWQSRIKAFEDFFDYAVQKGAYFVSCKELIDKIKDMQKTETFGQEVAYSSPEWIFFKNDLLNSSTPIETIQGSLSNVPIHVDKASGDEYPYAGFGVYENAGYFAGIDHISLTYKTNTPLLLRFTLTDDKPWEVLLNNVGPEVNSGKIPLSAFHYNKNDTGTQQSCNTAKIEGIQVQVLTVGDKPADVTISVKDVKLYGASTAITFCNVSKRMPIMAVHAITPNTLRLNAVEAGIFSIQIISSNGRAVSSFEAMRLLAGLNTIKLNNLSKGVYLINVKNNNIHTTIKAIIK